MEYVKGNLHSIHFENMSDLLDHIQDESRIKDCNRSIFRSFINNYTYDHSWYGPTSSSSKQVIEKSVFGDSELYNKYMLPKINQLNAKINTVDNINTVPVIKRRKIRSDFGSEIDIHYVNQGKLDKAWTNTIREEVDQEHHLITVFVDIGGTGDVDACQNIWTAVACLGFVTELERAGKQIQIMVGNTGVSVLANGNPMTTSCVVKKYNEHLNVEKLAVMTNIGFYRSALFVSKTLSENRVSGGMGRSVNFDSIARFPIPLQEEIVMGHTKIVLINKAYNLSGAIAAIKKANIDLLKNKENN